MKAKWIVFVLAVLTSLPFIASCVDEGCEAKTQIVHLAGQIVYNEYESGPIVMMVCEEESSRCDHTMSTPGYCNREVTFESPGAFSLEAKIRWAGSDKPQIALFVFNDKDDSGECREEEGDAGTWIHLPPEDNLELEIEIEPGECPEARQ